MNAQFVAIWKIRGISKLPVDEICYELFRAKSPKFIASLTDDPELNFLPIDRSRALMGCILKGLVNASTDGSPDIRIAVEIDDENAKRRDRIGTGAFLVLQGETEIQPPRFKNRVDLGDFSVSLDNIEKSEISDLFGPMVQAALAGVSLSLPRDTDPLIEKLGQAVFLIDAESGKPIYTFNVRGGSARLSVARGIPDNFISDAQDRILAIDSAPKIDRVCNLLVASLNKTTTPLEAFIAAWSALEIFVTTTFKEDYEAKFFNTMKDGAPHSAELFFGRLKEVMRDKYRIADKFLIVASVLDPSSAKTDSDEFQSFKKTRDSLFHERETPTVFPTEQIQRVLLKYMALHLDSKV